MVGCGRKTAPFRLALLKGGTFRLAIAREAKAVIAVDGGVETAVVEALESAKNHILAEYKIINPEMKMHINTSSIGRTSVISARDSQLTTAFLLLAPQGILEMEGLDHFCVRSSANLGELTFDEAKSVSQGLLNCVLQPLRGLKRCMGRLRRSCILLRVAVALLIRIQPGLIERNLLCRRRL